MELYRLNFHDKEIEVLWQLEPGSDAVTADRDKLLQAIRTWLTTPGNTPAPGSRDHFKRSVPQTV